MSLEVNLIKRGSDAEVKLNGFIDAVNAAADDHILLAVDQINKPVFIPLGHIARIEPPVLQDFRRGFGVVVIAFHDAGAFDSQFADAALDLISVFVYDLDFPAISGDSDSADLMNVLNAKMDTARADGFAQTIIGVILMIREITLPTLDQGGGDGLSADMHQAPLIQRVVGKIDLAAFDGVQNILGPGDQQPDDGAALFADCAEDPFRTDTAEDDRPASGIERAEPVHFRTGMVQRRNTKEYVIPSLTMMRLFDFCSMGQAGMCMQNGLGKTGGAGGEVNGAIVFVGKIDARGDRRAIGDQLFIAVRKRRTVVSDIENIPNPGDPVQHRLDPTGEFRTEDKRVNVGQRQAVQDLICIIAIIQRYSQSAGFQNAKIDRKPFQAVHQQNGDLISLFDAAGQKQIGEAVCFDVKFAPGHLLAESAAPGGFDQGVLAPCDVRHGLDFRVDLHKGDFIFEICGVACQQLGNGHVLSSFMFARIF